MRVVTNFFFMNFPHTVFPARIAFLCSFLRCSLLIAKKIPHSQYDSCAETDTKLLARLRQSTERVRIIATHVAHLHSGWHPSGSYGRREIGHWPTQSVPLQSVSPRLLHNDRSSRLVRHMFYENISIGLHIPGILWEHRRSGQCIGNIPIDLFIGGHDYRVLFHLPKAVRIHWGHRCVGAGGRTFLAQFWPLPITLAANETCVRHVCGHYDGAGHLHVRMCVHDVVCRPEYECVCMVFLFFAAHHFVAVGVQIYDRTQSDIAKVSLFEQGVAARENDDCTKSFFFY